MFPKTIQGKILFVSVCVNVLSIAISVVLFIRCRNDERAAVSASNAETAAALHGGMLTLQNFTRNRQKPPGEFIRELEKDEAIIFMARVNGLAWLKDLPASNDESLVRLKEKLKVAHEFIATNPDLFSTNSNK